MFTDAYWPRVNGVTVSVDSFSRALIKAGHHVVIVCLSYPNDPFTPASLLGSSRSKYEPEIIRVPSIPAHITKEDRIAKFNKWHWVFKQLDHFNPNVIHVNTEFMIAEFGLWYAGIHNLPVIYTFHTMWEDYGPNYLPMFPVFVVELIVRTILKNIFRRSYRVIVPTPQIEAVVHKYDSNLKTFLLPTGIDPELFNHTEEDARTYRCKLEEVFPKLKGKRILLFAGRVVREKNIGFLIKIFPDILAHHPDTVLLIAGNGPDLEYFKEESEAAGLADSCVFTGYLDRKDLALIYKISEVFVFPSLTDTQGLVTLEAMFSGTPVVAIGALGTLMVMGGDNGGFMVKDDAAEFTARVRDLLEDPELRKRKSAEAKIHASSWSIDELTKKLANYYGVCAKEHCEEYGDPRTPVWEYIMDKRWWKINNKILKQKTYRKWHEMLAKFMKQINQS